ncbi:hypothetical protein CLAIMM_03858 [Cladophialophora immunda]|nr:hypothetical protein CLAIMM_03858 [Cladophialophora immunda]
MERKKLQGEPDSCPPTKPQRYFLSFCLLRIISVWVILTVCAMAFQDTGGVREGRSVSVSSDDERPRPRPFRKLGQGSFGAVFAHPMVPVIYKREIKSDSNWCWSIEGEYAMHKLISAAFDKWSLGEQGNDTSLRVQIPFPHVLILTDSTNWWAQCSSRFPSDEPDFRDPSPTLQAERIPSLPQAVRHDLINKFCAAGSTLSRRRAARSWKSCVDFQIHNFPCHVDQMRTLGLDTHYIAAQLGRALAVLHFEAGVDGRDVEFVLGAARHVPEKLAGEQQKGTSLTDDAGQARQRREEVTGLYSAATIWCLDFEQCQPISFSVDPLVPTSITPEQTSLNTPTTTSASVDPGTVKCIAAYFANDPYYPRPPQPELWATFSRNYEDMAGQIGAEAAATASRQQQCSECSKSQNQSDPTAAAHVEDAPGGPDRTKSLARAFIRGIEDTFKRAQIKRCLDDEG